jgi:hypothetical protein
VLWEVPMPFRNNILKNTIDGWRLSTIGILQSGLPFSVYTSASYPSGDYNGDCFNYDFPNTPSFENSISVSRSAFITGVFNVSQFPVPPKGQEGNLGRNTFEGPGLANVNLNGINAVRIPWFIGKEGPRLSFAARFSTCSIV